MYAADLYYARTMDAFCRRFLQFLKSALEDPDCAVDALNVLPAEERRRVLVEWSGRVEFERRAASPLPSFLERFDYAASANPDAEAIVYGEERITYRELDGWSNRLAHALLAKGANTESLVAISCERSPAAMAAVLGVWKAGAAYVPLDPFYPAERRAWMLQDCGAQLLLTTPLAGAPVKAEVETILIDDSIAGYPSEPVAARPALEALAYVIYTSGSTGTPKGVMVEQRGVAALAAAIREGYPLATGERVLQYVSLSFDVCVGDIVSAFCQGATMVIPTQPYMLAGQELLDLLESARISQTLLPMSVLAQLEPRPLPHLIRLYTDVDWKNKELVINKAVSMTKISDGVRKWEWRIGPPKSRKSNRRVAAAEVVLELMRGLSRRQGSFRRGVLRTGRTADGSRLFR